MAGEVGTCPVIIFTVCVSTTSEAREATTRRSPVTTGRGGGAQQNVYTCSYSTTYLFLFLLRSGLQLLTSSASHGPAYPGGGAGERAVVERISKHLVSCH